MNSFHDSSTTIPVMNISLREGHRWPGSKMSPKAAIGMASDSPTHAAMRPEARVGPWDVPGKTAGVVMDQVERATKKKNCPEVPRLPDKPFHQVL